MFFPCVRETRYKRLEDVWFYLNDILERQAFRDRKGIALCEGCLSGREEKPESPPEFPVLTSLSDGLHPVRRDTPLSLSCFWPMFYQTNRQETMEGISFSDCVVGY